VNAIDPSGTVVVTVAVELGVTPSYTIPPEVLVYGTETIVVTVADGVSAITTVPPLVLV
jgi:hypothetical protein